MARMLGHARFLQWARIRDGLNKRAGRRRQRAWERDRLIRDLRRYPDCTADNPPCDECRDGHA